MDKKDDKPKDRANDKNHRTTHLGSVNQEELPNGLFNSVSSNNNATNNSSSYISDFNLYGSINSTANSGSNVNIMNPSFNGSLKFPINGMNGMQHNLFGSFSMFPENMIMTGDISGMGYMGGFMASNGSIKNPQNQSILDDKYTNDWFNSIKNKNINHINTFEMRDSLIDGQVVSDEEEAEEH
mgnify:CR=1 FL=1